MAKLRVVAFAITTPTAKLRDIQVPLGGDTKISLLQPSSGQIGVESAPKKSDDINN